MAHLLGPIAMLGRYSPLLLNGMGLGGFSEGCEGPFLDFPLASIRVDEVRSQGL